MLTDSLLAVSPHTDALRPKTAPVHAVSRSHAHGCEEVYPHNMQCVVSQSSVVDSSSWVQGLVRPVNTRGKIAIVPKRTIRQALLSIHVHRRESQENTAYHRPEKHLRQNLVRLAVFPLSGREGVARCRHHGRSAAVFSRWSRREEGRAGHKGERFPKLLGGGGEVWNDEGRMGWERGGHTLQHASQHWRGEGSGKDRVQECGRIAGGRRMYCGSANGDMRKYAPGCGPPSLCRFSRVPRPRITPDSHLDVTKREIINVSAIGEVAVKKYRR